MIPGIVIAALLLLGIVWFARNTATPNPGAMPQGRPTWMGADPVQVTGAVRAALASRGVSGSSDALDELAQHHAFDMASHNYCHEVDPVGAGLRDRRRRLTPDYIGSMEEWDTLVVPPTIPTPEALTEALLVGEGPQGEQLAHLLDRPGWTAVGLSVAAEHQRAALCAVFGRFLGTADRIDRVDDPPVKGWRLRGRWPSAGSRTPLQGFLIDDEGVAVAGPADAVAASGADPDSPRFEVLIPRDDPQVDGLRFELREGDVVVFQRSLP